MTAVLDNITRRKLILVRQLFQRAMLTATSSHSYVDRIMAMIGFDLATETMLKTVVSCINPTVQMKSDFPGILVQADAELSKSGLPNVPDRARILHVRSLRNDAQHKAKYPNETDVSDCRTYTRDFLSELCLNTWGINFESLSLVDIIADSRIKTLLSSAELNFVNSDFTATVIDAVAAFKLTETEVRSSIVGEAAFRWPPNRSIEDTLDFEQSLAEMDSLRSLLLVSIVGLEFGKYKEFLGLTAGVSIHIFQDGKYSSNCSRGEYSNKEAEFVLGFAINAVIQIESLVGDISRPFS